MNVYIKVMEIKTVDIPFYISFQIAKMLTTNVNFFLDELATLIITTRTTIHTIHNPPPPTLTVYRKDVTTDPAALLNNLLTTFNTSSESTITKFSASMLNMYILFCFKKFMRELDNRIINDWVRHVQSTNSLFEMRGDQLRIRKQFPTIGVEYILNFLNIKNTKEESVSLLNGVNISKKYTPDRSDISDTFKRLSVNFNGIYLNPIAFKDAVDSIGFLGEYEVGPGLKSIPNLLVLTSNPYYPSIDSVVKHLNAVYGNALYKYTEEHYKNINLFLEYFTFSWIVNIPLSGTNPSLYPNIVVDNIDNSFIEYKTKLREDRDFATNVTNFFKYPDGSPVYLYRYANVSSSCYTSASTSFDLFDIAVGKFLIFPFYLSTTLNNRAPNKYFIRSTTVLLKIKVTNSLIHNCIPLCDNSKYETEKEVLINRDSYFKITSVANSNITDTDYSSVAIQDISRSSKNAMGIICLELEYIDDIIYRFNSYSKNRYNSIQNISRMHTTGQDIIISNFRTTIRGASLNNESDDNSDNLKQLPDFNNIVPIIMFEESINDENISMLVEKTRNKKNPREIIGEIFSNYFDQPKTIIKGAVKKYKEEYKTTKSIYKDLKNRLKNI